MQFTLSISVKLMLNRDIEGKAEDFLFNLLPSKSHIRFPFRNFNTEKFLTDEIYLPQMEFMLEGVSAKMYGKVLNR